MTTTCSAQKGGRRWRLPCTLLIAATLAGCALTTGSPNTAGSAVTGVGRPDPRLTPGAVETRLTRDVLCSPGFTTRPYRRTQPIPDHPGRQESLNTEEVAARYGLSYPPHRVEVGEWDHLIPLELGGLDDAVNMWPQPVGPPGFREKDRLENTLHELVCSGGIELDVAQRAMVTDWYSAYRRYVGG